MDTNVWINIGVEDEECHFPLCWWILKGIFIKAVYFFQHSASGKLVGAKTGTEPELTMVMGK